MKSADPMPLLHEYRRSAPGGRAPEALRALAVLVVVLASLAGRVALAQQLEPRRWTHLPVDTNFLGAAYAYTDAQVSDQPALKLQDVQVDMQTLASKYIRTFELAGYTARAELTQAYQSGRWEGLLDGEAASTSRSGWTDTLVRFAVNFIGAPPLSGEAYARYRASLEEETIVGAAVVVHLPTGEYMKDRLINIGTNRFTVRTQLGALHSRGPWSVEATTAVWFYSDNDSFFGGNRLETDPTFTAQGHLTYTFRPGLWMAGSVGYARGGENTLNGVEKHDAKRTVGAALSAGVALRRDVGLQLTYLGLRRRATNGTDSDSFAVSLSHFW